MDKGILCGNFTFLWNFVEILGFHRFLLLWRWPISTSFLDFACWDFISFIMPFIMSTSLDYYRFVIFMLYWPNFSFCFIFLYWIFESFFLIFTPFSFSSLILDWSVINLLTRPNYWLFHSVFYFYDSYLLSFCVRYHFAIPSRDRQFERVSSLSRKWMAFKNNFEF